MYVGIKDKSGITDLKMFVWQSNQRWSLYLVSEITEFFHLLLSNSENYFSLKLKRKSQLAYNSLSFLRRKKSPPENLNK